MKALTSESQNFSTLKVLAKASCMIGLKGLSILLSKTLRYREILRSLIRKINKVKQAKIHCAKVGRVKVICPKHYINRYAYALVQLNKYETALNFIQISQNLTLDCLLINLNFLIFTQFLHDLIIKLFCRSKQNNFLIRSCKNCVKTGKFS